MFCSVGGGEPLVAFHCTCRCVWGGYSHELVSVQELFNLLLVLDEDKEKGREKGKEGRREGEREIPRAQQMNE